MSKSTFLTDNLLEYTYRNITWTSPASVFASLYEVVTGLEAGTGTETTYTGYARVAITFGAPGGGLGGRQISNTSAVTFGQKTDAPVDVMIAVGIHDASTGGNVLSFIFLDGGDPVIVIVNTSDLAGDTIQSAAHGFVNDDQVRLELVPGAAPIPTGLLEDTTYFVVGAAADNFQLSATMGGGAIDITAVGEILVMPLTPVTVNQNDTPEFATGALVVVED